MPPAPADTPVEETCEGGGGGKAVVWGSGRDSTLPVGAVVKLVTGTFPDLAGVEVAIGGGPALVQDGKIMEWKGLLHMRHPRSAVGFNRTHIFLVEVDGRQIDVSVGMTLAELAAYMIKLGCEQAMNFDGGGSSTLWALGAVRNSPSEGQERPAANALVIVKKKPSPQLPMAQRATPGSAAPNSP